MEIDEAPLAFGQRNGRAETLDGSSVHAHGQRARIVAIEYLHATAVEDARLGLSILVNSRIAIEVVVRHVENGRRNRA